MALVDSEAINMFIGKRFVEANGIEMTQIIGEITGGSGQKLADRIGYVEVANGDRKVNLQADMMEMPASRDLVIGLSHFKDLGYIITGVPVKEPGKKSVKELKKQQTASTV